MALQRIGRYRIDAVIGRGAIGVVYRGHDEQIDRPVAIKTLRSEVVEDMGADREALDRFGAEVRSAGRCLHPNIVTVFDFLEHDGAPYIVMEYVSAGTLENVTRANVLLPVQQVAEITAQLLDALEHAHDKGVIHRDIKPANILCPTAATIKVTDFGVAQLEALDMTRPGGLGTLGTPNYMAPERFLGRRADGRADLYAAGVILFQLLTGTKPFNAQDIPSLMRMLLHDDPPSLRSVRPELTPALEAVVSKALARNPDDRFANARAFADALHQALGVAPQANTERLDLTRLARAAPVRSATESSRTLTGGTLADRLAPATIDQLSQSLTRSLGPIAKVVLRKALQDSGDVDTLVNTLAREITLDTDATQFRSTAEAALREYRTMADIRSAAIVSDEEMRAAAAALLPIIGPLARIIVERQAKAAMNRAEFYRLLGEVIPDAKEKAKFLRTHAKVSDER